MHLILQYAACAGMADALPTQSDGEPLLGEASSPQWLLPVLHRQRFWKEDCAQSLRAHHLQ